MPVILHDNLQRVDRTPSEPSMQMTVAVLLKSTRDLNHKISADGRGSFRFKWPLTLNTSNKNYTLKNVSIYLLCNFIFLLEIDERGNPNTPLSMWLVQCGILTTINFQTNVSTYPSLSDNYSQKETCIYK